MFHENVVLVGVSPGSKAGSRAVLVSASPRGLSSMVTVRAMTRSGRRTRLSLSQGADGRLYLIDWDTVLLAPRERDLWELPGADGREAVLRLYLAWYSLAELGVYISLFHGVHAGDPNDAHSWANLQTFLPTPERWPQLSS